MKKEAPKVLTESVWLEKQSDTIMLLIERMSIAFSVDEFLEVYDDLSEAIEKLKKEYNIIEGVETDDLGNCYKKHIISDEEDFIN